MSDPSNPYAAPIASDSPYAATGTSTESLDPALAGTFGLRAGGRIIDTFVHYVLAMIGGAVGGLIFAIQHPGRHVVPPAGILLMTSLLGSVAYHTVSEAMGGASIGKLICGMRVLSVQGKRASPASMLIRNVAYFVDSFFFALPAYSSMQGSPLQQRLGDKWGGTVVMKIAGVPPESLLPIGAVIGGILMGGAIDIALQAIGLAMFS